MSPDPHRRCLCPCRPIVVLAAAAALCAVPVRAQDAPAPAPETAATAVLPELLLAQARRPFLEELWGAFTGKIQYRGQGRDVTVPVRMALRFTPESLYGEIALPGNQVYHVQQHYREEEGGVPKVTLRLPGKPGQVSLDDLGVKPEDITFCFLYWRFERERAAEEIRGQPCRVLELAHPQRPERVRAWLARDLGFPLRIEWYGDGDKVPTRKLEFRDFKRHGDFWFPKSLRLSGAGWKTMVTFTEADIYRPSEKAEPTHLFQVPPAASPSASPPAVEGGAPAAEPAAADTPPGGGAAPPSE